MEKLQIKPFDIIKDLKKVKTWKKKYITHPGYQKIRHFILDDTDDRPGFSLDKIIKAYYEPTPIGKNERSAIFSIIDNDDNLLGFSITSQCDLTTKKPFLHIDFIVINPEFQNQGVATFFLKEIISNPTDYLLINPHSIHAIVSGENTASLTVFKKFGFNFDKINTTQEYYRVNKLMPILEEEKDF